MVMLRVPQAPNALASLFAPTARWGWALDPESGLSAEELERRPPQPVPGEDYAMAYLTWRARILHAGKGVAPTWNAARPAFPYSSAAIFGGTLVGWDALVITMGASMLGSGSAVTLINLSERPVTSGIEKLAREWGCAVRADTLAPGRATIDLGAYSRHGDLVDFVLEVRYADRDTGADHELRDDRAVLRAVAAVLGGHVTARRLRAGLRVILRESERDEDNLLLSLEEQTALATRYGDERRERTDLLQRAARLEAELSEFVAVEESEPIMPEATTAPGGLRTIEVARTATGYDLEISRRMLVHAVLHRLRNRSGFDAGGPSEDIVILGADALQTATLDALADLAQSTGVRVTLLLTHLRGDALDALGAARAAIAFMRLPDPREAATASGYIGKDEKIVVGQQTLSRSENYSQVVGDQESAARGTSWSFGAGITSSTTLTAGTQNSETRGETITMSSTDQRVIEELVQPGVIQGLPETGLMLVNLAQRSVVFLDCDPTLVTTGA
jgi:hypothetical protein